MTYDPEQHHRHSIRLRGYEYARAGLYFVTICTQDRACLFGEIADGVLAPTLAGVVIEQWWHLLPDRFPGLELDAFVVMPNHVHGIVVLGTTDECADGVIPLNDATRGPGGHGGPPLPKQWARGMARRRDHVGADLRVRPPHGPSLPHVVQWFKSITTTDYRRGVAALDWPPFNGRLWQRNYYEHIIRTDVALDRVRAYIATNPANWDSDTENPAAPPREQIGEDMRRRSGRAARQRGCARQ